MQAVEFKTVIQDGSIKLPEVEELTTGREVKVIVMWADTIESENVEDQISTDIEEQELDSPSFMAGSAQSDEKPSDFAGIWKNRRQVDAKKLRQRAWARKNNSL